MSKLLNLLQNKKSWTKGANARTKDGNPTHSNDEKATCWCLQGAIYKVNLGDPDIHPILNKLQAALPKHFRDSAYDSLQNVITYFNDHPDTTHEMVLEAIRKAGI